MNIIKELTEPKITSDGIIRTPSALMLRAGKALARMKEVILGMERNLHTMQLQMQTDIRNIDSQLLNLINENNRLKKQLEPIDLTEFHEINNRDRD